MQNKNRFNSKFWSICTIAAFIFVIFSGIANAETFNVSENYGTIVLQNGFCERIGAIKFQGQFDEKIAVTPSSLFVAADANGDNSLTAIEYDNYIANNDVDYDEITIELLAGATVCNTVGFTYDAYEQEAHPNDSTVSEIGDPVSFRNNFNNAAFFPDSTALTTAGATFPITPTAPTLADEAAFVATVPAYSIVGVEGESNYTIFVHRATTITGGPFGGLYDTLVVGNKEAPGASGNILKCGLCINLEDTPYEEQDPLYGLVQVSYRDIKSNAFSGDRFVATVKNNTGHSVGLCSKSEGEGMNAEGWADNVDPKTGLIQIPLCNTSGSQNQDSGPCGCVEASRQICIKIEDNNGNFGDGEPYEFRIGNCQSAKMGVGIANVTLRDSANNEVAKNSENRYGGGCNLINASPVTCDRMVDTKIYEFTATMNNAGTHYLIIDVAYDSCEATVGEWAIDLSVKRDPCGDSFRVKDLTVAEFVDCGSGTQTEQIFPYSADVSTGWWSGLALTNPNDSDITVEMEIYEADGDKYTAAVDVPAKQIAVGLMNDSAFIQLTPHSDDASFGDERFWILARAPKPFYGFLMMGDSAQAQGYLSVDYESVNF